MKDCAALFLSRMGQMESIGLGKTNWKRRRHWTCHLAIVSLFKQEKMPKKNGGLGINNNNILLRCIWYSFLREDDGHVEARNAARISTYERKLREKTRV